MGPTIGRYLEDSEAEIPENLDEERVQRKPHSELKVTLRQRHMADRRNMWPLQISRLDQHETVFPRYLFTFLWCNRRFEVATANHYLLFYVYRRPEVDTASYLASTAPLSTGQEATSGAGSVEEALGMETSIDKGSP